MSKYCHVVPWYNSEEWQKVYEELSDSASNKEFALKILLVWKARSPFLPSGIESTLSLLQVYVEDVKQDQDAGNNDLLRLAYSSAIMRFVNHMLDAEAEKGSSLYTAAKNLGVPDWIIDLRHDTAHSNNLPNITLLREACAISLLWLKENYWDKYKFNIQDFITGQKHILFRDESKIGVLIDLCTALSICAHPNCKIKNLSEISDLDMRESILTNIKHIFGSLVDLSNPKTVSISSLINLINKQNQDLFYVPNVTVLINEAILGDDELFLSEDLINFYSAKDFKNKNKLSGHYVQCFEVLLTFLHTNDFILEFVMALIKITQDNETPTFKARLAAMWVSEILSALKRSQEFSRKLKKMNADSKQSRKKKDLKQLYYHWFPNFKEKSLLLDLNKPVPHQLANINYIQPIIAAYNPYLIYFVRDILNLIDPSIPAGIRDRVYKLAEIISSPEKFLSTASATIYTVDDLKSASEDDDDIEIIDAIESDKVDVVKNEQDIQVNSIWRLAPKNHNWASCPIGVLPWQQKEAVQAMEIS